MDDIPEGLVEAVARAIGAAGSGPGDGSLEHWNALMPWQREYQIRKARAAILAQHAWYDEQNQRMSKFVEFQGPNPRG